MKMSLGQLTEAVFIQRDNRFRAEIELSGERYKAHVANSGRMRELLTEGRRIWVKKADSAGRKTPYDLVLVEQQNRKICLNAHLANDIFDFWLKNQLLPEFKEISSIYREKKWGESRFDFAFLLEGIPCLLEVKSVNLVIDKTARFPDAPTKRGTRHLQELIKYQQMGNKSFVVFIIMGNEAEQFLPNTEGDPEFAEALAQAKAAGVAIRVYRCRIDEGGAFFDGQINY